MEKGRATININIDVEIDNVKIDDVITSIISKIHKGESQGEGVINNALFNFNIQQSYINDFRVEEMDDGRKNLIFQSKINK